ncbi:MAG TPA: RcnB family protein [Caulobacteraceae bacterium]
MKRTLTAALALAFMAGAATAQPDFNDHRDRGAGHEGQGAGDQGQHHHDDNGGRPAGQTGGQRGGAPVGGAGPAPQGVQTHAIQPQGQPDTGGRHNWQGQVWQGRGEGGYQGPRGGNGATTQPWHGGGGPVNGRGGAQNNNGGQNYTGGRNYNGGQNYTGGQGGRDWHGDQRGQDQRGWRGGGGNYSGQGWRGDNRHDRWGFDAHPQRDRDRGRTWFQQGLFPETFQARHRYRAPFYRPGGWYYQRWSYGEYLPFGWFAPAFYLYWGYYDLPAPPVGCEWVRQGDDALLVDIWTGEILSVYYDVFY